MKSGESLALVASNAETSATLELWVREEETIGRDAAAAAPQEDGVDGDRLGAKGAAKYRGVGWVKKAWRKRKDGSRGELQLDPVQTLVTSTAAPEKTRRSAAKERIRPNPLDVTGMKQLRAFVGQVAVTKDNGYQEIPKETSAQTKEAMEPDEEESKRILAPVRPVPRVAPTRRKARVTRSDPASTSNTNQKETKAQSSRRSHNEFDTYIACQTWQTENNAAMASMQLGLIDLQLPGI